MSFDSIEAFYDSWWDHNQAWGLSRLYSKGYYYRVPSQLLAITSELLRVESLSEADKAVHRPDLPLRVLRSSSLIWTNKAYSDIEAYKDIVAACDTTSSDTPILHTPSLVLLPFGPKGGLKRGVIIKALNEKNFSAIELLWHAHNIQALYIKEPTVGVGLYRLGIERGLPSFYIGRFYDAAGFIEKYS